MAYSLPNLDDLPQNAQIPLADLVTSPARGKRGYTRFSEAHIRRLEASGQFPKARRMPGCRLKFYVAEG